MFKRIKLPDVMKLVLLSVLSLSAMQSGAQTPSSEQSDVKPADTVAPFKAIYDLNRRGDNYGEGRRSLVKDENGIYTFKYSSHASFLFLSDTRSEESRLLLSGGTVLPIWYQFNREGTGKDKMNSLQVNQVTGEVTDLKSSEIFPDMQWQRGIQDPLSYQLQMQQDMLNHKTTFEYQTLDKKGELKPYVFEVIGRPSINVPMGKFDTVKLQRVTDKEDRQTYVWLAPELDYSLVRLQQIEDGKETYDIVLKQFQWLGTEADGKDVGDEKHN